MCHLTYFRCSMSVVSSTISSATILLSSLVSKFQHLVIVYYMFGRVSFQNGTNHSLLANGCMYVFGYCHPEVILMFLNYNLSNIYNIFTFCFTKYQYTCWGEKTISIFSSKKQRWFKFHLSWEWKVFPFPSQQIILTFLKLNVKVYYYVVSSLIC